VDAWDYGDTGLYRSRSRSPYLDLYMYQERFSGTKQQTWPRRLLPLNLYMDPTQLQLVLVGHGVDRVVDRVVDGVIDPVVVGPVVDGVVDEAVDEVDEVDGVDKGCKRKEPRRRRRRKKRGKRSNMVPVPVPVLVLLMVLLMAGPHIQRLHRTSLGTGPW